MIERTVAAVHLTETRVWARHGDRTIDRPAGVLLDAGVLEVGVTPIGAVDPDVYEPSPLRFVDDSFLALGDNTIPMSEVLAALFGRTLGLVGAAGPVDLLVLTCPTEWGSSRRRTMTAAGRSVARDVRVLSVADAVEATVDAEGPGVVLEIGILESAATSTVAVGTISFDELGAMDLAERADAATELAVGVHDRCHDAPAWVAVTGRAERSESGPLAAALRTAGRSSPRVVVVDGAAVVTSAHEWGLGIMHSGTAPRRTAAHRGRRAVAVAAAVSAVAVASGLGTWALRLPNEAAPPAATVAPGSSVELVPTSTPTPAVSAVVGRVAVVVPSGWHERVPASRPDRIEMVRDDGVPARILVVHKELTAGSDFDSVAEILADRIAERSETFGPLSEIDVDARHALTYREAPDPDSEVRWLVFVGEDLQISIGCQGLRDRLGGLEADCDRVVRSLEVDPK
ncbi:type VII secretion-associated protein [Rhodococcus sp. NPDC003318]|uniref:type VII secretion-associated protein n=1 Tax=Rhodococcus sp. NPDC003318 TaxID=3364503 RepID=UPI0036B6E194